MISLSKEDFEDLKPQISALLDAINSKLAEGGRFLGSQVARSLRIAGSLAESILKNHILTRLLRLFRERGPLDRSLSNDIQRTDYDSIRSFYVALAKQAHPKDPIVNSIALMKGSELASVLQSGNLLDAEMLPTYFEVARMIPCEMSISLLIDQLDPTLTSSPSLLERLEDGDTVNIAGSLVRPYLGPQHFKRLFMLRPPRGAKDVLRDILWTVAEYSSKNFIAYLAACHELAILISSLIVKETLQQMASEADGVMLSPLPVGLGHLFLAVEGSSSTMEKLANRLLRRARRKCPGMATEALQGLEAIIKHGQALIRISTSSSVTSTRLARLRSVAGWALALDTADLEIIQQEGLVNLLDLFRVLQLKLSNSKHLCDVSLLSRIGGGLNRVMERSHKNSLGVILFLARTRMSESNTSAGGGLLSWFWPRQSAGPSPDLVAKLVRAVKVLAEMELGGMAPCYAGPNPTFLRASVFVGDLLAPLDERLNFAGAEDAAKALLGALFSLPSGAFLCDRSMGPPHLGLVEHLNQRLECYCGDAPARVEFPAEAMDAVGGRVTFTKAPVQMRQKKMIRPMALQLRPSKAKTHAILPQPPPKSAGTASMAAAIKSENAPLVKTRRQPVAR